VKSNYELQIKNYELKEKILPNQKIRNNNSGYKLFGINNL